MITTASKPDHRKRDGRAFAVFEGLENRTLFSASPIMMFPAMHLPPAGSNSAKPMIIAANAHTGLTPAGNNASESFPAGSSASQDFVYGNISTSDGAVYTSTAAESSNGWWTMAPPPGRSGMFNSAYDFGPHGHAMHDQTVGVDNDDSGDSSSARDTYVQQQGGMPVNITVQPEIVAATDITSLTVASTTAQDHPAVTSAIAAVTAIQTQNNAVTATNPKTARATGPLDSGAINTTTPPLSPAIKTTSLTFVPISSFFTASTPHTHVDNNLLVGSWNSSVAEFSQAAISPTLDWEIATATATVSTGAQTGFVENLIASDASALAHVANTLAMRLYEEDSLLWKETAAFVGAAMLIGSYIAKQQAGSQDPPRKTRVKAKHLCVGE
jgi:hypothetical protein